MWVQLQNLKGAPGWYSGMGVFFPVSLLHGCLSRLEKWKAGLKVQEGGDSDSHTHFKTDVQRLTPSQKSLGRK